MSIPTKEAALYQYWNSFTWNAFEENSVPDDAVLPYITYQNVTDRFGNEVPTAVSLWHRSDSWVTINAKADEIAERLKGKGEFIPCKGGLIQLRQGSPFAQNMIDDSDDTVKRKYLNITVEFLTNA